jgi:hypothetical protein
MAASRLPLTLAKMPAGAGHSWVGARAFAIASTNDQPRGS